jgi:hypothetical protein
VRHRRPILLTALLLGSASPAGATDTVPATVHEPSAVRTSAGIEVYGAFSAGAYHLMILRGGVVRGVPVAAADAPFEADIGPDGHGRPELIYSRCRADGNACELFLVDGRPRACQLLASQPLAFRPVAAQP